jgi:uncharacterized protein YchJ
MCCYSRSLDEVAIYSICCKRCKLSAWNLAFIQKTGYYSFNKILDWYGLHIARTEEGNERDTHGVVAFKAEIIKKFSILYELSRFVKENNQWLFINGDIIQSSPAISSKVGRNAPCQCGSGKKYKKCCGQ